MALLDNPKQYLLFGGNKGWHKSDWTASDDRVRGGKSQSYLECTDDIGRFHGSLDIEILGGAGFASQRTTGEDRKWNLNGYAGIELRIAKGDKKRYTFNLKDELLPPDPETGREQSTISYECDFELPSQTKPGHACDKVVFIPWSAFNATYRGRLKKDAPPINRKKIKRMSIMMRSFFGSQEGDFSLSIKSIAALSTVPSTQHASGAIDYSVVEKGPGDYTTHAPVQSGRTSDPHRPALLRRSSFVMFGCIALVAVYFLSGSFLHLCHQSFS